MSDQLFRTIRFVAVQMLVCIAVAFAAAGDGYTGSKLRIFLEGRCGQLPNSIFVVQNNKEDQGFEVEQNGHKNEFVSAKTPRTFLTQGTIASVRYGTGRTRCATSSTAGKPRAYEGVYWFQCNNSPVWHSLTVGGKGMQKISYVRFVEGESVNCEERWMNLDAPGSIETVARDIESIYVYVGPDAPEDYHEYDMLIEKDTFGKGATKGSKSLTWMEVLRMKTARRNMGVGSAHDIDRDDLKKRIGTVTLEAN